MDRFFSKLDLRDIKIDPFKTSFPPDAEEDEAPVAELVEVEAADQSPVATRRPHTPAWATTETAWEATEPEPSNGFEAQAEFGNGYDDDDSAYADDETVAAPTALERRNGDVLKVSARSRPSAVAGAIAGVVRENGRAEVQAIGAGATNQAVKAVAIARDYLRETGIEAICLPAFIDVTIENEDRTAIRLVVEPR